jgi:hypothetical protein
VPPKVDADAILYRRGVRITPQSFNRHSLYRYNFDDISINESRIFNYTYEWQERIAAALAKCTSIDILHAVLHELQQPHSDVLECEARWEYVHGMWSDEWLTVLGKKRIYCRNAAQFYAADELLGQWVLPGTLVTALSEVFDETQLNIVGRSADGFIPVDDAAFTARCAALRDDLADLGYSCAAKLRVGEFIDTSMMAQYLSDADEIRISVRHHAAASDAEVQSTLLEETCHALGHRDGTREFEQYLMQQLLCAKRAEMKLSALRALLK